MLAPDSPAFLCLISWFRPCLPLTTLPQGSPGNNLSLPTTILVCPFLDSGCLLPWLSGDYLIQLYRVSVTPVSSVASCTSGTRIIPSLSDYNTEFSHYSPASWAGSAGPNLQSSLKTVKGQRPEDCFACCHCFLDVC